MVSSTRGTPTTSRQKCQAFKSAGMQVTLAMGLHMQPDWVFNVPDSKFIDEKGKTAGEPNLVFNQVSARQGRGVLRPDQQRPWEFKTLGDPPNKWGRCQMLYPDNSGYWAFNDRAEQPQHAPFDAEKPCTRLEARHCGSKSTSRTVGRLVHQGARQFCRLAMKVRFPRIQGLLRIFNAGLGCEGKRLAQGHRRKHVAWLGGADWRGLAQGL